MSRVLTSTADDGRTMLIIIVSVPSDTNTSLKTYEKISKYKDLEIEIAKS